MRAPDPPTLFAAWERGLGQPDAQRALALLAAASPDGDAAALAEWPIGKRDHALLALREALFGPELATVTQCPACGEQLEAQFSAGALRMAQPDADEAAPLPRNIECGGYRIEWRPPSSADLATLPRSGDSDRAQAHFLDACVVARDAEGRDVRGSDLPASGREAVARAMAQADPFALVELEMVCAACGHRFAAIFDIAAFLLREVQAWARQLLRDIDTLARAYGWREADVLALSPLRRQIYVEMARA